MTERGFLAGIAVSALAITVFLVWSAVHWHTGWPLLYLYLPVLMVICGWSIVRQSGRNS